MPAARVIAFTARRNSAILLLASWLMVGQSPAVADDGIDFFESRIRPLLATHCYGCHGERKQEGGLRLDSRLGWLTGGDAGAVIQPGDPSASRLIAAVMYSDPSLQMPPSKRLSDRAIDDLRRWVELGAPDPRLESPAATTAGPRALWSLQPVSDPSPSSIEGDAWSDSAIDRFVVEQLQAAGLEPSPEADRRTLLRRLSFTLTGLPPSLDELADFESDSRPDAYEKCIDRLLSSAHYGEHWARHWLDVARYSDTKGYVYAREEKRWVHAATYRDWVVDALNDDLPYNQFVRLQIAADQIAAPGSSELAAMGFLTLGRRFLGVTHDIYDDRIDVLTRGILGLTVGCARCHDHKYDPISTRDYYSLYGVFQSCAEQVVTFGELTEGARSEELAKRRRAFNETYATRRQEQAARTRSAMDRYLLAQLELEKYPEEVFNQILEPADLNPVVVRKWQAFLRQDQLATSPVFAAWHLATKAGDKERLKELASQYKTQFDTIEEKWRAVLAANPTADSLPDPVDEGLRAILYGANSPCWVPNEHLANTEMYFPNAVVVELWKLQGDVDRWLIDNSDAARAATILVDRDKAVTPRVFNRGNPLNKGAEVPRRILQALGGSDEQPFSFGSGRLELANSIADPRNPLTARVMVNRVWMHHFGAGLVTTPSDFGFRAEQPSHPLLLDWLAKRFVDSGWSLKALHRTILLSKVFRQNSLGPRDEARRKLAQQIDPGNRLLWRMNVHRLTIEEARDAWLSVTSELNHDLGGKSQPLFGRSNFRRTCYAFIDRESVSPTLSIFDFANPDLSIPQRNETIVPQQALFALNHPFLADRARKIVSELRETAQVNRLAKLFNVIFLRAPTMSEHAFAEEFLKSAADASSTTAAGTSWSYGFGEFSEAAGKINNFTPLPYFTGSAWQGGEKFPDGSLGWLQLTAIGGHPGNDKQHAVVRRWTAQRAGKYRVESQLTHEPAVSDGVRAFVSHSRSGQLHATSLRHNQEKIDIQEIVMESGDTLDFVVDIRDELNSDQFLWSPSIHRVDSDNAVWSAERDFGGSTAIHLDPWQQLAQVLLLSNEFTFLD